MGGLAATPVKWSNGKGLRVLQIQKYKFTLRYNLIYDLYTLKTQIECRQTKQSAAFKSLNRLLINRLL